ncbi:MAG: hypothetical protein CM15mP103_11330 [Gammaproteobacteria bacterium]|nr:MAG: hypothetical protein CM15mP103_11330 [Gammaproteobacteria bacterium]
MCNTFFAVADTFIQSPVTAVHTPLQIGEVVVKRFALAQPFSLVAETVFSEQHHRTRKLVTTWVNADASIAAALVGNAMKVSAEPQTG